ncbi:hypothetical protein OAM77_03595, partial [Alphaproteobacteria bacterium]|nr:hypothetical protein [Alphaproteobacteria bacterium]
YSKPETLWHRGYSNHSNIYSILNIPGVMPVIEHSPCNRIYEGMQATERLTNEQKITYRCPPTRRNPSGLIK